MAKQRFNLAKKKYFKHKRVLPVRPPVELTIKPDIPLSVIRDAVAAVIAQLRVERLANKPPKAKFGKKKRFGEGGIVKDTYANIYDDFAVYPRGGDGAPVNLEGFVSTINNMLRAMGK